MGYTHYWYKDPVLNQDNFNKVVADFEKMIPIIEHLGVKIADGFGEGKPIITTKEICFNGPSKCGHQERDLGITWPSDNAQGVAKLDMQHRLGNETKANIESTWFAGYKLNTRTCGGDCSHETFMLEQQITPSEHRQAKEGKYFDCTKTAYKPYDLAVNVCLIIAKHHLKSQIIIHSDGELEQWKDAIELCEHFLGYGSELNLNEEIPKIKQELPQVQTTQNMIKVGDVFFSSWGYDQTNIDYYKIVKISATGKTCQIVKIGAKTIENTGFMSEKVIPDPEKIIKEREWIGESCLEVVKTHRATVRKDREGKIWLRAGTTYGGYLWVYDGPNIATHYA